jgi:hypothetical protein
MFSITLTSSKKSAIKAIKLVAKEMGDITISETNEEETDEYFYIKGVRIKKGKGKLDVEKNAGSLSHIHFEDPKVLREKAWRRKKSEF